MSREPDVDERLSVDRLCITSQQGDVLPAPAEASHTDREIRGFAMAQLGEESS